MKPREWDAELCKNCQNDWSPDASKVVFRCMVTTHLGTESCKYWDWLTCKHNPKVQVLLND
jgi:hypothetical protein